MTTPTPDVVLSSAVDLARAAVLEIAPADHVGEHVGVRPDTEALATHTFVCLAPGYRGWAWAVTVAVVPHGDVATVSEVVLLPGGEAILAPAWVPWNERVRPGDLNPGDLYPTSPDDPRLEPGFGGADALEADDETTSAVTPLRPAQWELGLGRETVLSAYGRGVAADRWYDGEFGPDSPMAKAAPGHCRTCGFFMPIGGLVGQAFGACANEFGADGRIVALGYGCGAHSSVREIEGTGVPVTDIVVDENVLYALDLSSSDELVVEVPTVVVEELMADDGEVVAVTEAVAVPIDPAEEAWRLGVELVDPDEADEVVGLPAVDGGAEDEDEADDDGYLVDEDDDDEDDDDEDDEDEADDDGYLADDDEDDEDDDVAGDPEVSPDQIALVLDDVDDIEPDETL